MVLTPLKAWRKELDKLDRKILNLFQTRMEIVLKIAEFKEKNNLDIVDQGREKEILEQVDRIVDPRFKEEAGILFAKIMELSKRIQEAYLLTVTKEAEPEKEKIIGFQGLPGSFSEQALYEYYGEGVRTRNYESFEDVFKALQKKEIDYGILPLENFSTGGITEVYDLLNDYQFYIVGEKVLKVDHNLLAPKGADLNSISRVRSHPQAFLQCSKFLKNYPDWELIPSSNTAVSAKRAGELNSASEAVIASKRAAELYGLAILFEDIHNYKDNSTRFIIIGQKPENSPANNKISLVVTSDHKPGALVEILSHFAASSLNMLKIESRPKKNSKEYIFYIDFEGHLKDSRVKEALGKIERDTAYMRVLGNYFADQKL